MSRFVVWFVVTESSEEFATSVFPAVIACELYAADVSSGINSQLSNSSLPPHPKRKAVNPLQLRRPVDEVCVF